MITSGAGIETGVGGGEGVSVAVGKDVGVGEGTVVAVAVGGGGVGSTTARPHPLKNNPAIMTVVAHTRVRYIEDNLQDGSDI